MYVYISIYIYMHTFIHTLCERELLEGPEISAAGLRENAKAGVLSLNEAFPEVRAGFVSLKRKIQTDRHRERKRERERDTESESTKKV